ncbi:MAG: cell wall-binding repeat-containing protein [Coriobacteriales bacterium]
MNRGSTLSLPGRIFSLLMSVVMVFLLWPSGISYATEADEQAGAQEQAEQVEETSSSEEGVSDAVLETGSTSVQEASSDQSSNAVSDAGAADPVESKVAESVTEPLDDPDLTISTEQELRDFAASVNSGTTYKEKTVVLANDIELTSAWTPIGNGKENSYVRASFQGTFDGQGHTISGLYIDNTDAETSIDDNWQGLFGRVSGSSPVSSTGVEEYRAVIKNLVVKGTVTNSRADAGGIAAYANYTDFINCGSEVTVKARDNAGGIVGEISSSVTVSDCYNWGNVTMTGAEYGSYNSGAGGIVGTFGYSGTSGGTRCAITNCYNWGTITSYQNAGGIAAVWFAGSTAHSGTMTNCYNAGNTVLTENTGYYASKRSTGSLVGRVSSDSQAANNTVTNCYGLEGTASALIGEDGGSYSSGLTVSTECSFKTNAEMVAEDFATTLGDAYSHVADTMPLLSWQNISTTVVNINSATVADIPNETYNGSEHTPEPVVTYNGTTLVKGTDYSLSYVNNIDAGTAIVYVNGMGSYVGSKQITFTIDPASIETATVSSIADQTFSATPVVPEVTVTLGSTELVKDTDYTTAVSNADAVGTATLTVTGTGNYTGTVTQDYTIVACDISSLSIAEMGKETYTGSAIEPDVTITDGSTQLVKDTDYTLAYENNVEIGTATVTITGIGNYTGTATTTFEILSPYRITTEQELKDFRDTVNGGNDYEGITVLLEADIALTSTWTPIGTATNQFKGTFEGNDHTISGLDVQSTTSYAGLFGYNAGTIQNLTVTGAVSSSSESETEGEADFVAGIAGFNAGTIKGVTSNVEVSGDSIFNIGGIAGRSTGTITESQNLGPVSGYKRIGGIAGTNYGTITYCMNSGDITSTFVFLGSSGVVGCGGIAGMNGDMETVPTVGGTINGCYNVGVVGIGNISTGWRAEGGIAGFANDLSTVKNCYDTGLIVRGYTEYAPIVGRFDTLFTADNNYSLEGLNAHTTSGFATGIIKTDSEMKASDFATYLGTIEEGTSTSTGNIFKYNSGGYPLLFWQTSAPSPKLDITKATVSDIPDQTATGDAIEPDFTVTYNGTALVEGTDYDVSYADNISVGNATVTITGKGGYYGTITKTFVIQSAGPKVIDIATEEELISFRDKVNSGFDYADYTVNLTADIQLTSDWVPIGLYGSGSANHKPFRGVFDGHGHTISGINYTTSDGGFHALFAYVEGTSESHAVVKNVTVSGTMTDTCDNTSASYSTGGIAGIVGRADYAEIIACANKCDINGCGSVAGIVAYMGYGGTTVTACHNYGDIKCESADTTIVRIGGKNAGGIVAYLLAPNKIESCYNTGDISSTSHAGGIVGFLYPSSSSSETLSIANCYNTGQISNIEVVAEDGEEVVEGAWSGGIIGAVSGSGTASSSSADYNTLTNCYTLDTGCDKLFGDDNEGGLVKVDTASSVMTLSQMTDSEFAGTLGDYYKINISDTPLLYWEVNRIEGVLVDDIPDQEYTGEAIEPTVNVTYNGEALEAGTDYTVSYSHNINAGLALVTITGTGSFSGEFSESFRITPVDLTIAPSAQTKMVGNSDPEFTATATGLKGTDEIGSCTITRSEGEELGSYTTTIDPASVKIVRGDEDVTSNYTITCETGTFKVRGSKRLYGSDRYETANAVVADTYTSAEGVIIVSGESFPDALAASSLSGALDYPILLTPTDSIKASTLDEIRSLGATKAIICGGNAAVSSTVEWQLENSNLSVERIKGATRYETAEAIYDYGCTCGEGGTSVWKDGEVILVSGAKFADALSISPYAAGDGVPILLVDENGSIPTQKTQSIASSASLVIIVGGKGVVSQETQDSLSNTVRLSGKDRYKTSQQVCEWLSANRGYSYDCAGFATGVNYPDALAASSKLGKSKSMLLLVSDSNYKPAGEVVSSNKDSIDTLYFFGGKGATSETIKNHIDGCMQ